MTEQDAPVAAEESEPLTSRRFSLGAVMALGDLAMVAGLALKPLDNGWHLMTGFGALASGMAWARYRARGISGARRRPRLALGIVLAVLAAAGYLVLLLEVDLLGAALSWPLVALGAGTGLLLFAMQLAFPSKPRDASASLARP